VVIIRELNSKMIHMMHRSKLDMRRYILILVLVTVSKSSSNYR